MGYPPYLWGGRFDFRTEVSGFFVRRLSSLSEEPRSNGGPGARADPDGGNAGDVHEQGDGDDDGHDDDDGVEEEGGLVRVIYLWRPHHAFL